LSSDIKTGAKRHPLAPVHPRNAVLIVEVGFFSFLRGLKSRVFAKPSARGLNGVRRKK
jgi:hypothetical protein